MDYPFKGHGAFLLLLPVYLAGVFVALGAGVAWPGAAAGALLLSLLCLTFRLPPYHTALAVMVLCGVLAGGRIPLADPDAARRFLGDEVVLQGVVEESAPMDTGWKGVAEHARVASIDGSASMELGKALLYVRTSDGTVRLPAEIRATGRLHPVQSRGNPEEIPREWGAMAMGVQYVFSTDASRAVFLDRPDGRGVLDVFRRARERTSLWMDGHAGRSDGALYLRSLTTGEVPSFSHPMVALLRKTGLAHLLAISGVNVAIFFTVHSFLARCVLWIFRRRHGTPDLNRAASLVSVPVCWAYVLMAGAPVPAVRSAGMITLAVALWNTIGLRRSDLCWTILCFVTVIASPFLIFSPSFLLSYGATFFLIAAFAGKKPETGSGGVEHRFLRWGKGAVLASTVAFLGTLPVSSAFFGAFPAGAVLWNLLFGPVLGTAGVAGAFLAAVGGAFSIDFLGPPVRFVAQGLTAALSLLARASGDGWGYLPLPPSGTIAPFCCFAAAAWGTIRLRRSGKSPWPAALAGAVLFLAWIHLPYAALPDNRLSFTALNVGKGAAHVVSFPGGKHMVIDCGGSAQGDAGGKIVAPFLRSRGIRKVDVLVLTHPHEDHYGGAKAILEGFAVGEIWIPEGPSPSAFGEAVAQREHLVRRKRGGDVFSAGGADVFVRGAGDGNRRSPNEQSLQLEVRHGKLSVWLPGDVETGPAAWGSAETPEEGKRFLFLPHHGSAGAKPLEWVGAAKPAVVISQNRNCFAGENPVHSAESFLLENGAFTVRSNGDRIYCGREGGSSIWKLLWRLP
ncbi:MAG: ComEC/Rec2 family competence protein [Deltaproteobacteria bacterium]|nr:ComEC/Rec2 family competence protein [Deltaproteobacteria bacterium]